MITKDIEMVVRKEPVITEVNTVYSVLTCRGCARQEDFKGKVDMTCLPGGWASLTLRGQSINGAYEWLLCPVCVTDVRTTAGLDT